MTDTSPDAERVWTEVYRNMTIAQKWQKLGDLYESARILSEAGVRLRTPFAANDDIRLAWMTQSLGNRVTDVTRGT